MYLSLSLRDRFYFYVVQHYDYEGQRWTLVPCSRGEWPYSQAGKKGKRLFGNDPTVFQTCVLGLPGQVNKFRFESSASHGLGLLDPFATQSNKSNIIMINLDIWLKFYHGWVELVAYIELLIN